MITVIPDNFWMPKIKKYPEKRNPGYTSAVFVEEQHGKNSFPF